MKILWVKTDFLHPTTRGGQIRTLEMLKRIHARHEVHYVCFADLEQTEGPSRAPEYCSKFYEIPHYAPEKSLLSPAFLGQLAAGLISPLPVAVNRWRSVEMKQFIEQLAAREPFDAMVCDFLFPAPNLPDLSRCVLFQHNVEALIWKRHAEQAGALLKRLYFHLQARRMFDYEREVCRRVKRVVAVSESDARLMREMYGVASVQAIPTGVDVDYFRAPANAAPVADLVFLGSMDWMPNIDGIQWFCREILPLIRRERPQTTVAVVGRKPTSAVQALAAQDSRLQVTGTVPDVRPYLWGAALSVVPLKVGGGTRLKIYEAMAAGVPVVSTSIGAEGLEIQDGHNIALADDPAVFAERCLHLLASAEARQQLAASALAMVTHKYGWDSIARQFEAFLA